MTRCSSCHQKKLQALMKGRMTMMINCGEALMQTFTQHFIAVKRADSFSNTSPPLLPSTNMDCDWPPRCVVSLPNMVKLRSEATTVYPLPSQTTPLHQLASLMPCQEESLLLSPPKSDRIIYVNPSSFHHITRNSFKDATLFHLSASQDHSNKNKIAPPAQS